MRRPPERARGYSAWSLLGRGLSGAPWPRAWAERPLANRYDVVVVGGGGHGLATAYYLARRHGYRSVAVLERGWIGGGNTGRNTTIVRSNYLQPENIAFYDHSLKLWARLSAELNYNVMYSPRGVLNLAHSDDQMDVYARRGNAMRLMGVDAELLDRADVSRRAPLLDTSRSARFPVSGGLFQPRGGTVRHDAVAWGYARAASRLGVDIVQNCEVQGFRFEGERICEVLTSRGPVACGKVALAVAGHTSELASHAGLRLPIESHLLQAIVTEPIKPVLDTVVTFGAEEYYVSQSDKGGLVMGGALDGYASYSRLGSPAVIREIAACAVSLFPAFSRLRMLRHWAGLMDMTMDGCPIVGATPTPNLYVTGGWCYGGFKATPASGWTLAHTIAHDEVHPLIEGFRLDRFADGRMLFERGVGPVPQAQ